MFFFFLFSNLIQPLKDGAYFGIKDHRDLFLFFYILYIRKSQFRCCFFGVFFLLRGQTVEFKGFSESPASEPM